MGTFFWLRYNIRFMTLPIKLEFDIKIIRCSNWDSKHFIYLRNKKIFLQILYFDNLHINKIEKEIYRERIRMIYGKALFSFISHFFNHSFCYNNKIDMSSIWCFLSNSSLIIVFIPFPPNLGVGHIMATCDAAWVFSNTYNFAKPWIYELNIDFRFNHYKSCRTRCLSISGSIEADKSCPANFGDNFTICRPSTNTSCPKLVMAVRLK